MDREILLERTLNRIIQGRLRLKVGDLVLFVFEPSLDIIEESFDIYDEAYDKAYFSGSYVDDQIMELLLENNLWSPADDQHAEKIGKQIEDVKVDAFQSFFNKKKLMAIKRNLRMMEKQQLKYASKRKSLDHLGCKWLANWTRQTWIVSQTTRLKNNELYDFANYDIQSLMSKISNHLPTPDVLRAIARGNDFRTMWTTSKSQSNLFGKPACKMSNWQLQLVSYAIMYDSVYESPDKPSEDIINDDDCLDGWFIREKRKYDEEKKKKKSEDIVNNSKIANSQEVYLFAQNKEEAEEIHDLNNPWSKKIVRERNQQISAAGKKGLKFTDLHDVKQDYQIEARKHAVKHMKRR